MFPNAPANTLNKPLGEGSQVRCQAQQLECDPCDWMTDTQFPGSVSPVNESGMSYPAKTPDRGTPTMYPGRLFTRIHKEDLNTSDMWDDLWAGGDTRSSHYDTSRGGGPTHTYDEGNPVQNDYSDALNPVSTAGYISPVTLAPTTMTTTTTPEQTSCNTLDPTSISQPSILYAPSSTPTLDPSTDLQSTGSEVTGVNYDDAVASASISQTSSITPLATQLSSAPLLDQLTRGTVDSSVGTVGNEPTAPVITVPATTAQAAASAVLQAQNPNLTSTPVIASPTSPQLLTGGIILILTVLAFSISWGKET